MALINYIEPVNVGSVFAGIGVLISTIGFLYILMRLCRPMVGWFENMYNKDSKYSLIEEKMLDDIAKEKGIDLDAELLKRNIISKERKSFRKKVEDEVFQKMFPDNKKK